MRKLFITLMTVALCGVSNAQIVPFRGMGVQQDTVVSTFNMGIYDVDEDCYKDTTFYCYKVFRGQKLTYFSIQLIEHEAIRKPAFIFLNDADGERPIKQLVTLIQSVEHIRDKYIEWSNTAKENRITDYKKEIEGCNLKKQTFYLWYWYTDKNTSYISKTRFFFTPIFRVTDIGKCLLRLEQEDRKRLGEFADATSYLHAKEMGDRQKIKEYLRKGDTSDFFKLIGFMQFSSPEQVQSLIDALRKGLKRDNK